MIFFVFLTAIKKRKEKKKKKQEFWIRGYNAVMEVLLSNGMLTDLNYHIWMNTAGFDDVGT